MNNKNIGKRILSLVLLLSMILSMVPTAFAQGEAETEQSSVLSEEKESTRGTETVNPATIVLEEEIPGGSRASLSLFTDVKDYQDLRKFSEPGRYLLVTQYNGTKYVYLPNQSSSGVKPFVILEDATNTFSSVQISLDLLYNYRNRFGVHCVVPDESVPNKAYIASNPSSDELKDGNGDIIIENPANVDLTIPRYLDTPTSANGYQYAAKNIWSDSKDDAILLYYTEKTWTKSGKSVTKQSFFWDNEQGENDPFLAPHDAQTVATGSNVINTLRLFKVANNVSDSTMWSLAVPYWHGVYLAEISGGTFVDVSELKVAIEDAQAWLGEVYAAGDKDEYNPVLFAELEALVITAADFYNIEANGAEETASLVKEIADMTEALKKRLAKVQGSVLAMDIPVTFYDFRADGLMFEAASGTGYAYTLENGNLSPSADIPFPGVKGKTLTSAGEGTKTTGLTEKKLVKGQMVYTEKTVEYLAWYIAQGYSRQFTEGYKGVTNELHDKVTEISNLAKTDWDTALGSWEDTLNKTDTGDNGGTFIYDEIVTAFDLAYYISNNIWREVDSHDILETLTVGEYTHNLRYNMAVDAYDYLRLTKDPTTGAYTITSDRPLKYVQREGDNVGYIFNPDLNGEQTIGKDRMRFTPLGGTPMTNGGTQASGQDPIPWLGFDALEGMADETDLTRNEGFHFSMHAYGSFVYQEALNQYFYFLGDDDVYYYINDTLVMDLGGAHPRCDDILYLNDVADELGLKDGDVYSFNMFYAERHTNESNMIFSTNIQIMDTETFTSESQFVERNDELTEIPAGTKVEIGETVTYRYELLNARNVPVRNLVFTDKSLGVTISNSVCILGEKTNDGNTAPVDKLTLYYYGSDVTDLGTAVKTDIDKIRKIIKGEDDTVQDFAGHAYSVTGLTKEQLMELMALGLPGNSRIAIHGFERVAKYMDQPFISELFTSCEYDKVEINSNSNGTDSITTIRTVTLNGAASVSTLVYAEPEFSPEEMRVVIDYGKPVDLPLSTLEQRLFMVAPGAEKVTKTFVGISSMGTHGMISMEAPTELVCGEVGKSYHCATAFGDFLRTDENTLRYTPGQFLSTIARAYGVYRVDVVSPDPATVVTGAESVPEADRTTSYYVSIAIEIIPATMMYYEAESFTDSVIETVNTTDGGSTSTPWATEPDSTDSADAPQDFDTAGNTIYDMVIDRGSIPTNAFFADFDGKGAQERYDTQLLYNGYDFDAANTWQKYNAGVSKLTVDRVAGTLELHFNDTRNEYHYAQTVLPGSTSFDNTAPLMLKPNKNHYVQARFKVENCVLLSKDAIPQFAVCFSNQSDSKCSRAGSDFAHEDLDAKQLLSGEYITVTIPLGDIDYYTSADYIDALQFQVANVKAPEGQTGKVILDYLYVGPITDMGTEKGQNHETEGKRFLFFDFKDDANAQTRYSATQYNGLNYDAESDSQTGRAHYWTVTTGYSTNRAPDIDTSGDGVVSFEVNERFNNLRYGPYLYMTNTPGQISGADEMYRQYWPLNCEVPSGKLYYRVRFKLSGVKFDKGETNDQRPFVQCSIVGVDANDAFIGTSLSLYYDLDEVNNTGKYIEKEIEVASRLQEVGLVKIKAIYVRFVDLVKSGTAAGRVDVDYLYLGPQSMSDTVRQNQETSVMIDFNNTDVDKQRYSADLYSSVNHDDATKWSSNWFEHEINEGKLILTPKDAQENKADGYGSVNAGARLKYKMTGNDYIQVRFRVDGAQQLGEYSFNTSPSLCFYFGQKNSPGTGEFSTSHYFTEEEVVDQGWITYTYDISAYAGKMDTMTFLYPAFFYLHSKDLNNRATYTIDYIYVGPLKNAGPPLDSLFFGFDNGKEDQERYTSDTYGGYNYDIHDPADSVGNWATSPELSGSTDLYAIDNLRGFLSLGVTEERPENGVYGPYLITTNKYGVYSFSDERASIAYHPRNAEYLQIRFRVRNCTVEGGSQPRIVFLYGGYDGNGNQVTYNTTDYPTVDHYYTLKDNFQTVTIPIPEEIRKLNLLTNMGLRFQHIKSGVGGTVDIDYIYIGPGKSTPEPVYGYDSSYTNDGELSNGNSLFVMGQGVKVPNATTNTTYTEAYFPFTGTGFDLISRTGKQQATIRVTVYSDEAMTDAVKALTVNNKGDLELYQIPVASVQGLEYGTYYVAVGVNKAATYGTINGIDMSFMNRGGEFYFDAIRIYDPIDVTGSDLTAQEQIALDAYRAEKEAHAHIKEVRNILLSAKDFNELTGTTEGAVFLDVNSSIVDPDPNGDGYVGDSSPSTDYFTLSVQTYNKIGPKNEVYLAPNQAIAFRLRIDSTQIPASVDIGAKTIVGGSGELVAGFVTASASTDNVLTAQASLREIIESSTAQYYALNTRSIVTPTEGEVYLVIYNNSEVGEKAEDKVISITDIKVAYATDPNAELPEDDLHDTEINPDVDNNDSGSSNDGGTGSSEADPAAVDTQTAKRAVAETETAPVCFVVDGRTTDAVECFLKALFETPLDDTPTVTEEISILHSLNLASDISINYVVPKTDIEGYENIRLCCVLPQYQGNTLVGSKTVILEPVDRGPYYYFVLDGLTAVNMNDVIEATLHMTIDGRSYYSEMDQYSVAQYAYAQLKKAGIPDKLKTLCADLLRYGAAAQTFKNYRTDNPADSSMVEAEKAYLTDLGTVTFGSTNAVLNDLSSPAVTWVGKALDLNAKVGVRYVVDLSVYEGNLEELELRLCYRDYSDKETERILTAMESYLPEKGLYAFTFDGLLAAELRTVISAQLYAGDTPVSATLQYSPDTYGNGKTGTLGTLCKALMAYSDSANAYFAG